MTALDRPQPLCSTLNPMSSSLEGRTELRKTALLLLAAALLAFTQQLPAQPTTSSAPSSAEARAKALHSIFHDYWEQTLKRQPEFASSLGDKRYNDQISDYSVKAINDWLAVEQEMLLKLAGIDPAGLPEQDQVSRELLIHH